MIVKRGAMKESKKRKQLQFSLKVRGVCAWWEKAGGFVDSLRYFEYLFIIIQLPKY